MFLSPLWHPFFDATPYDGPGAVSLIERITTPLYINDLPLHRTGMILARASRQLDTTTRPLPETSRINGLSGGRYITTGAADALDLELVGTLIRVHYRDLQRQVAVLEDWLGELLEMRWTHALTSVRTGMAGNPRIESVTPDSAYASAVGSWQVTVPIRCADGAVYRQHPTRLRLSTTPVAVPVGALAVGGTILLEGPLSGAVNIDVLSPSGVRLDRLALLIPVDEALDTGDVCTISLDAPHRILKRTAGGVLTSVYHWRQPSASTGWWQIAPRHADRWRQQYPLLRLSTGGGWHTYVQAEVV